jgi:hypothetical protein
LPTDVMGDPTPPPPPSEGGAEYGPAGSQAREHRWYGANRWRNHWQDQTFDDGEPPVAAGREDSFGMPGPGDLQTRPEAGHKAAPPRAGGNWPGDGLVQDQPFGDRAYQGQAGDDWPGDGAGRETGAQTRAPVVSPGSGGTPLSWDEDE